MGDKLELILPAGNVEFTLDKMMNTQSDSINVASGSGHTIKLPYSGEAPKRGLLARFLK